MPSASLRGRCQPWRLGRRPPRSARSSAFVWSSHTARLNQAHARAGDEQPPSHIPLLCASPSPVPGGLPDHRTSAHPHQCSLIRDGVWDTVMVGAWAALSLDPKRPACSVPTLRSEAPNCDRAGSPGLDDVRGRRVFCDVAPLQDCGSDGQRWSGDQLGTRACRAFQGRRRQTLPMPCPALRGEPSAHSVAIIALNRRIGQFR